MLIFHVIPSFFSREYVLQVTSLICLGVCSFARSIPSLTYSEHTSCTHGSNFFFNGWFLVTQQLFLTFPLFFNDLSIPVPKSSEIDKNIERKKKCEKGSKTAQTLLLFLIWRATLHPYKTASFYWWNPCKNAVWTPVSSAVYWNVYCHWENVSSRKIWPSIFVAGTRYRCQGTRINCFFFFLA